VKGAQHSLLDKALLEWFMNLRAIKIKVNGPVIMTKAGMSLQSNLVYPDSVLVLVGCIVWRDIQ
jgi:hypothetical protein